MGFPQTDNWAPSHKVKHHISHHDSFAPEPNLGMLIYLAFSRLKGLLLLHIIFHCCVEWKRLSHKLNGLKQNKCIYSQFQNEV